MRILSITLAALLLFPANAEATPERAGMGGKSDAVQAERFKKMDINNDGILSRVEFMGAFPSMQEAAFLSIDSNEDNSISLDEWQNFSNRHSQDMRGSGMGGASMGMGGGAGMSPNSTEMKAPAHDKKGRTLFELAPKNDAN